MAALFTVVMLWPERAGWIFGSQCNETIASLLQWGRLV
jgi:hypothetical protein